MNYRTITSLALASSVILFAGTSLAVGPAGQADACCSECAVNSPSASVPVVELSSEAANELLKMREEEKLARDVYSAMHEKWGAQVFNIRNAEQRHMDAMKMMLNRFGLTDPITENTQGIFTTKAFTDLYTKLVDVGSGSLLDALKVGAKIEELDLYDLRAAAKDVNDPVLTKVYANLQRATRNHLRAFAAQIEANDGTYTAAHLTQEEFDTIASSDFERGNGHGKAKGQGKGQGQGKNAGKANKDCGLCDG